MKNASPFLVLLLVAGAGLVGCSSYNSSTYKPPSGINTRVVVSQSVSSPTASPGLIIINGANDRLARGSEISGGGSPTFMTLSPNKGTLLVYDGTTNTNSVQIVNARTESSAGSVQLSGPSSSLALSVSTTSGYAAVPSGKLVGYPPGAIEVMNLTSPGISTVIGVPSAQTVVTNSNGSQLLVFSNDSNAVSVVSPLLAIPPVDTGCDVQPSSTCTQVDGFDRPVYGFFSTDGSTAYILNCGAECSGSTASVQTLDLGTMSAGPSVPLDGATFGLITGTTLYVAGNSPTNNSCAGQTTGATVCGRLDIVDLSSMTVTGRVVIPDGYHNRMDLSSNGQLFVGSRGCTNIGNVNNPNGEVRGCLAIYDTQTGNVVVPPDNGDVTGLQSFSTRLVEYVVEGGQLRIYDTTKDILQRTQITLTGQLVDVKAIDFF